MFNMGGGVFGGRRPAAALASQASSAALTRLSPTLATSAGVSAGDGSKAFAKNGNTILSSYPLKYSTNNGESFGDVATGQPWDSIMNHAVYGGGLWVIGGQQAGDGAKFFYNNNTIPSGSFVDASGVNDTSFFQNWTTVDGLAYGDGKWLAVGQHPTSPQGAAYSTNITSGNSRWAETNGGLSGGISAGRVSFGNGYFISGCTASNPAIIERAAASNITSWQRISLSHGWINDKPVIAYDGVSGRWVVLGVKSGNMVAVDYSDNDGATWTPCTIGSFGGTPYRFNSITALPSGGFIATGELGLGGGAGGMAAYSADGITWAEISGASGFQALYGLVAL